MRALSFSRVSAAATALAAGLLVSACGNGPPEPTDPGPRPVRTAVVEQGPMVPPVRATGTLSLREETRLSFLVGGVVREITVREGDTVRAGQRLAALDASEVDAGVAQARASHDKARRDLERGRRLAEDNVITQQQLDDLGTAEAVAGAQLRAVQFNRRHAVIEAPADGTVLRRMVEANELVSGGQPVLLLGSAGSGFVLRLGVTDTDVLRLRLDDKVAVTLDAHRGIELVGRVIEIGGAADPRTGTFRVEVAVDPDGHRLASGMIARAVIHGTGLGDGIRDYVPVNALVEGDARSALLFLIGPDGEQVREHRAGIAFLSDGRAALDERLPDGVRVITDGASFLRDGETVRVID